MKIISKNPNDGVRHAPLETRPPSSLCIAEVEKDGKVGALIRLKTGQFVIQTGGEYESLDTKKVIDAIAVYQDEQNLKMYNRFFNDVFGGEKTVKTKVNSKQCGDCDHVGCDHCIEGDEWREK